MIDNVDQDEWTNSSVSLDPIVRRLEDQFVDDLFILQPQPDQPGSVSSSLRTDQPGFFCVNIFKSDNR